MIYSNYAYKIFTKQLSVIEAAKRANHQQRGIWTESSLKFMYCKKFSLCRFFHLLHSFKRKTVSPLPSTRSRQPEQPWRNPAPQKSVFKD